MHYSEIREATEPGDYRTVYYDGQFEGSFVVHGVITKISWSTAEGGSYVVVRTHDGERHPPFSHITGIY